ncbi:MAG: hypothetical protein S4CHLAM6_09760 [Chlamydiae bacterium]|nr:hypothetical protein [Chlamydiota bacterium]
MIALTESYFFDKRKNIYKDGIVPDVSSGSDKSGENALEISKSWLNNHKSNLPLFLQ